MSVNRMQQVWLRVLDEHLRSAHAHELTAALAARMRDSARAAVALERAAAERSAHAAACRAHPEWSPGVNGSP
jgi:hypothetical protein